MLEHFKIMKLTSEEKTEIKSISNFTSRLNKILMLLFSKINIFMDKDKEATQIMLDNIESNRMVGTNISYDTNKIVLDNTIWKWKSNDYLGDNSTFMFLARGDNTGPVTFKVDGLTEYPMLDNKYQELYAGYLSEDKIYMVMVLDGNLIPKAPNNMFVRVFSIDETNDEIPQDDFDHLVEEWINEEDNPHIIMGVTTDVMDSKIELAIAKLKLELEGN